jgi:arylsulfatase A-like enzyme
MVGVAVALGLTAAAALAGCRAAPLPLVKPNIILIVTDDQAWNTLDYMPTVKAELAAHGVTFTNAFDTTPLCCPSRASLLTGLYAHHHGVFGDVASIGGVAHFQDQSTLATWLHDGGYRTALVGKYLNGYVGQAIPPGWDDWHVFLDVLMGPADAPGRKRYYNYQLSDNGAITQHGTAAADYSTDVLTQRAVEFIRTSAGHPFFLYYAPYAPHDDYTPAPRHRGVFQSAQLPAQPDFNEADLADKPGWMQGLAPLDKTNLTTIWQRQLETLQAVDDGLGAMIKQLKDSGAWDNTVIIFTSDNGYSLGAHRWLGKRCPYEECLRTPLVVLWPGNVHQEDRLALNIDLAPTILELTGITPPARMDGQSLVPLLAGARVSWREDFVIEYWDEAQSLGVPIVENRIAQVPVPSYRGIRSVDWKYIEYADTGEAELYNLPADPYELNNLAGDPAYSDTLRTLHARLETLIGTDSVTPPPIDASAGPSDEN